MTAPAEFLVRGLTIKRPWARLIVEGHKPVEFRGWATTYLGPLFIHAGTGWAGAGKALAARLGITLDGRDDIGLPGWIGLVDLIDIHHIADRRCVRACKTWSQPGPRHWQLTNHRALAERIPGVGRLSLFTPPAEVIAAARAQGLLTEPGRVEPPRAAADAIEEPPLFGGEDRG